MAEATSVGLTFDGTAPVTQASNDIAAVGVAAAAARRDHRHGMPTLGGAGGTPAVVLGTAAAAGVQTTFLRDDDTIVAFDATAPVTQAYADAAAVGVATVAARRDHRHGMPAAGAVTRAGGNTVEASTTSTTGVDLLSASGLSIGASLLVEVSVLGRKTAGAGFAAGLSLKLNALVLSDLVTNTNALWDSTTTDRAEDGMAWFMFITGATNYQGAIQGFKEARISSNGFQANAPLFWYNGSLQNRIPIATLTDVVVRGVTDSALITLSADELNVYSKVSA